MSPVIKGLRIAATFSAVAILLVLDALLSGITALPGIVTQGVLSAIALGMLVAWARANQKSLSQVGLATPKPLQELGIGFLIGLGLIVSSVLWLILIGSYRFNQANFDLGALLGGLVFFLLVALFEETLFRGILFQVLESELGSWIALFLSALLFGLIHLGNDGATIYSAIAIALEAGVLLAVLFIWSRSLWLVIGTHWAWNFVEGNIFGVAVSGNQTKSLLEPTVTGPNLWSGGSFGLEAGLGTVLICLGVAAWFLHKSIQEGKVRFFKS